MKVVTWNCNGALRNKFKYIAELNADIYILQECENPSLCNHTEYNSWANNFLWKGENKNRGLGIFAKNDILLELLDWSDTYIDHQVKYFLPCSLNQKINLLGVWTMQNKATSYDYIGQLWKYMQINKPKFENIILAGDFNSNTIWDKRNRLWNHSNIVNDLRNMDINSLYHMFYKEEQGEESRPTFFLQRNRSKPYHIDYIFATTNIEIKMKHFEIAKSEKWLTLSDHLPLICEFED